MTECNTVIEANKEIDKLKRENEKLKKQNQNLRRCVNQMYVMAHQAIRFDEKELDNDQSLFKKLEKESHFIVKGL